MSCLQTFAMPDLNKLLMKATCEITREEITSF